ncbi:MAG: valine--tRNA ligase [Actinomycetota bacterium]
MTELAKAYDPKGVEEHWYAFWEEKGYFTGPTGAPGDRFCISMPPGNITGALHIGGALNNIIQDTLIRRARMQGRPTLWVPGTDHAAIATQNVLERRLAEEGKTRFDLGREAFEALFWEWKDEYEAQILGALRRLGCSADWTRTRFTMDPGLSHAVRTVFVRLYEEGHIYRGARIINWCPRCTSAISDIEVNHIEIEGELVTLRYPLSDGSGFIPVATTRVETMLGDTGVAVNPKDERYEALIDKTVVLPLVGREIPIVSDDAVELDFGTGAVKVTPAHDANDFEIAERAGLPAVNIFDETATVNDNGGRFAGLDRYEARKAVLEALREEGAVEKEERPYLHSVGHCDRCGTEIEPWLSEQWFVAMKELAKPAIDVVEEGRIRFVPQQPFKRVYLDWMENIRDWCISRQIWLGHRIPAWYCPDGHITVGLDDPDACSTCGSSQIEQDVDTLDTWFSSALWPFSTLGWPEDTEDLRYWYPTTVLATAREIIYLWVARMIFTGLHFVGDIPFHDVVVHPVVRDAEGRKMSRSLGNVIDPLETIDQYGTDALRLSMLLGCALGQDMSFSVERVEGARRFCNKLWNAARFALLQLDAEASSPRSAEALPERWILSRLARAKRTVENANEVYDFAKAADAVYHFVWSEFCDWYLEMAKLKADDPTVKATLYRVLENALRLAHPMIPFITEELWQKLPRAEGDPESIMIARWPAADDDAIDAEAEREMEFLQAIVGEVRRFRHEHKIAPRQQIEAVVKAEGRTAELVATHASVIKVLARLSDIRTGSQPAGWSRAITGTTEIYLPVSEHVDLGAERERLERSLAEATKVADRARAKLANGGFVSGAPTDVVDKVRAQLAEQEERAAMLRSQLEALGA